MTITLQVRNVVNIPAPYREEPRWVSVFGALEFSYHAFRLYHLSQDDELDETVALRIDDWIAAEKLRDVVAFVPPGRWWYFGEALVCAWTRLQDDELVLCNVQDISLLEPQTEQRHVLVRGERRL